MIARHFFLALAAASLIAGCGGGDETASLSPQKFAAAQRADVHAAATVTPAQAANQLLDYAQSVYPGLFPAGAVTQSFGPFAFRYYQSTNMYLGVAIVADPAYVQNGIYVVGQGFGTLANPAAGYQGTLSTFLPNLVIDTGLNTGHTLTISGTAGGFAFQPVIIQNVPAPNTEVAFCTGLASDSTFSQITAAGGGTVTITHCSFNGLSGTISALVNITYGTTVIHTDFSITYTYQ